MPPRKFRRPLGERRYRKLFVIATEGTKTEPQYFALFNDQQSIIQVKCIKGKHDSSPLHVLNRMAKYLKKESLKESLKGSDEAWLIVDKDQWTDEQLVQLHKWSQQAENYGFGLSNPKFEYWLLLPHFEDGTGITSSRDCTDRLKRYLPEYDKSLDVRKVTTDRIEEAITRAKHRDTPPCMD